MAIGSKIRGYERDWTEANDLTRSEFQPDDQETWEGKLVGTIWVNLDIN